MRAPSAYASSCSSTPWVAAAAARTPAAQRKRDRVHRETPARGVRDDKRIVDVRQGVPDPDRSDVLDSGETIRVRVTDYGTEGTTAQAGFPGRA